MRNSLIYSTKKKIYWTLSSLLHRKYPVKYPLASLMMEQPNEESFN